MNKSLLPATKFTLGQSKARRQFIRDCYFSRISKKYIEAFILDLELFLQQHGYKMGIPHHKAVAYCKAWLFGHVWVQRNPRLSLHVNHMFSVNSGGKEEYDWYDFTISTYDWIDFAQKWAQWEMLDEDSLAGKEQFADLPRFAWNLLSLEESKSHLYWLRHIEEEQTDEYSNSSIQYQITGQEDMAYGGDRRTYS